MSRFRLIISGLAVAALLVGCSSNTTTGAAPASSVAVGKPLTLAQAEVLASVLTKNFDAGGAVFTVAVPFSPQTTYGLSGFIDYTKGVGQAVLRITSNSGKDTADSSLFWTKQEVLEELPGLPEAVAALGRPGVRYVSRALTTSSPQDIVLGLLLGSASTQRENPGLIQQGTTDGGSAFLRTDALRGVAVDVFRFGKKTTYWVGHDDGYLMRLEANLAIAPGTTVIDFLEHKTVTVAGPKVSEVVLATDIPEVMKAITGNTIAPATTPATTPASTPASTPVTTKP